MFATDKHSDCEMVRVFDDIGFVMRAKLHQNGSSVDFLVYKIEGTTDDNQPLLWHKGSSHNGDLVANMEQAETWLDGFIRFDGCSNWLFSDCACNRMIHFCSATDAVKIGELFQLLYGVADELLPNGVME